MTSLNNFNNVDLDRRYNWTGKDVLLVIVGIILFGILSFIILFTFIQVFPDILPPEIILNGQTNIYVSVGAAIFESVTIFFGVYLFGIKRKNYPWTTVGLKKISNNWIALSVIIGIIAIPLSSLIANLLQNTLNLSTENPQLPFLVPDNLSVMGMIIMAILVGLIVPFVEELFFRGIIYSWLRNRFNIGVGILISSAIFGLVHVDLAVAGTAFVLGIILGLVFEYSKSLWASVIIHSINNGIQILILYAFIILGENPI